MKKIEVPFHRVDVGQEEIKNIIEVIKSGWWTFGPKSLEFENQFRKYLGVKEAISLNSCTSALHLALLALDIGQGDEVIIPAITFSSTAQAVIYTGAKPVFIDVNKDDLIIDPVDIEKKISKKTKAIIVVDFAGQPGDYSRIKLIAKKHQLKIISDAAHTLPSYYKGKSVGGLADISCFSFYATKTLAIGDGGMITTNKSKYAKKIRILRSCGMNKNAWKRYSTTGKWFYQITELGYKYNMTDIDAAIGLAQLKKNKLLWQKRKKIANFYNQAFSKIPEIIIPKIHPERVTSWHLYVIKLDLEKLKINRNLFIEELAKNEVGTSVHFIPLYRHPYYKKSLNCKSSDFPNSEWVYKRIISLPIFPSMTKNQIDWVIHCVKNIVNKNRK